MTHAPLPTALRGSRLVRFLSDLAIADVEISHKDFPERLGRLIELADSIDLSSVHGKLSTTKSEPGPETGKALSRNSVSEELLAARKAIVESIISSFAPGSGALWSGLRKVKAAAPAEEMASHERYQLFYVNQQREIAGKVDKLRSHIRATLSGRSSRLARLAVLDATLEATLSAPTRKLFAEVPKLLGKRFECLYRGHQQTIAVQQGSDNPQFANQAGGWLEQFTAEMQASLLAELDARLQPVLGLIEALYEEVEES